MAKYPFSHTHNLCACGAGGQQRCPIRYTHRASRNSCACGAGGQQRCPIRYTHRASRNSCASGAGGQQRCPIRYELTYSSRVSLAIQVTDKGKVKVLAPKGMPLKQIEDFILQKEKWIRKQQNKALECPVPDPIPLSEEVRRHYIEMARNIFKKKTAYYASILHVTYGRISIREQKTLWGSCSSAGNLNYNWRIIFAPEEVVNYIVIHELAHRREMNHSPAFYKIVASVMPDYKQQQAWLKEYGRHLRAIPAGARPYSYKPNPL